MMVRRIDVKNVIDQRDAYALIYQRREILVEDDSADKLWYDRFLEEEQRQHQQRNTEPSTLDTSSVDVSGSST
jgi:exonuclease I